MDAATTTVRPPSSAAADVGPRWSPVELLPSLLIALLGTVLLAPGHALWFDELFSAEVARLPLGDLFRAVVSGEGTTSYLAGVPPSYNAPYYLLAHFWVALPGLGSDDALRVLSLLAVAGGLALITRAVTRLAGRTAGVLAGATVACSPLLLEQAVEARSYGLVVLATGGALLGLVRWLQQPPRGLLLFGLAGAAMGLMHWYAVTALAGFVVAALLLRGRRAVPVLAAGALAVLPVAGLVVVNLLNGTGARNAEHLVTTHGRLADKAVAAWAGGHTPLLYVTVTLAVLGALRARGIRVVGACWVLVPLLLLLAAELVRPVYLPRYLLAGLVGLGVLAAVGAAALPRRWRLAAVALLLGCALPACLPVLERGPRERGDEVVALLADRHGPGEPIVAADQRSALALDHYVRLREPGLRPDVVLPPDDAPPGADRVWLVRRLIDGEPEPTDDDGILEAAGLHPVRRFDFAATKTDLIVQLWSR